MYMIAWKLQNINLLEHGMKVIERIFEKKATESCGKG